MGDDWEDFRNEMPITHRWAYFDHASVAPIPRSASHAVKLWADQAAEQGTLSWPTWNRTVEKARQSAAQLIGADTDEIALVRSTTEGIGLVAEGFSWKPGDNVVTLANEFPSNLYPWMNLADRGVETRRVPVNDGRVDLDAVAAACDSKTRIVSLSWVGYAQGWRLDLDRAAELVHSRGALLFVDAIQGLGAFPINLSQTPIDFLAADGHKWMIGPEGAGLLFVRREHLARLRAIGIGWNSVVRPYEFNHVELDLKPSAGRYEGGAPNSVGFAAFGAALDLLNRLGADRIARGILEISGLACDRLQSIGAQLATHREQLKHSSGIVSFEFPGHDPIRLRQKCIDAGVVLSCRSGRLRISPHAYVNEQDVDRLVDALKAAK